MSTVTIPAAQAAAGGRTVVTKVNRKENVYDATNERVGTSANPYPVGVGPGEAQTTVVTWTITSLDRPSLSVEVVEAAADTDPAVLAKITAAGAACRAQAALPVVQAQTLADAEDLP